MERGRGARGVRMGVSGGTRDGESAAAGDSSEDRAGAHVRSQVDTDVRDGASLDARSFFSSVNLQPMHHITTESPLSPDNYADGGSGASGGANGASAEFNGTMAAINGTSRGATDTSDEAHGTSSRSRATDTSGGATGTSGGNQMDSSEKELLELLDLNLFPDEIAELNSQRTARNRITKIQKEMFALLDKINRELGSQAVLAESFADTLQRVAHEASNARNPQRADELTKCVEEIYQIHGAMRVGLDSAERPKVEFIAKQNEVANLLERSARNGPQ